MSDRHGSVELGSVPPPAGHVMDDRVHCPKPGLPKAVAAGSKPSLGKAKRKDLGT